MLDSMILEGFSNLTGSFIPLLCYSLIPQFHDSVIP